MATDNPLPSGSAPDLETHPTGIAFAADAVQHFRGSERGFLQLLESVPDALLVVDKDGRIVLMNSQVEKCFGYDRERLLGVPIETLIPERFRDRHREKVRQYIAAPQMRPMGIGSGFIG